MERGLIFIFDPDGLFTYGQIQLAQGGILIMLHQLFQWTEGVPKTAEKKKLGKRRQYKFPHNIR